MGMHTLHSFDKDGFSIQDKALAELQEEKQALLDEAASKNLTIKSLEEEVREKTKKINSLQGALDEIERLASELQKRYERELREIHQQHEEKLKQERERYQHIIDQRNDRRRDTAQSDDSKFWISSCRDVKFEQTLANELGRGAWGTVYRGHFHGQPVAIKVLHRDILSEYVIGQLKREVHLMAKVRHPCLLLFIAAAFDHPSTSPLIITEILSTSLRALLQGSRQPLLDRTGKQGIARDVAAALNYLHTREEPILHRDVSSANVLLEEMANGRWKGKLSDFGSANIARQATTAVPGAEIYTAPEVPRESILLPHARVFQTAKMDVYSYGVLLCELFAAKWELPSRVVYERLLLSVRGAWPEMSDLIVACNKEDPTHRPTMTNVLHTLDIIG